ncbi:hypothetical protein [Undibacterium fentianense]|uniref:Cytochrome c family protein n=1 Tax=Undibacterium fentianense TaxID=2828728 RepID=A0A941E7S5_9BURK|nr:hypothetical protein [Undibacterium fentianense]MBR7801313.1 hypothetical protein [Undibacterium fentianense]
MKQSKSMIQSDQACKKSLRLLTIATLSCLPLYLGSVQAQTILPQDAKALCSVAPQNFKNWFSGTVTLNGPVNPANSMNFPNGGDCDFYQWSEQMFLWLTSPAPKTYGGNGFVFNTPIFYNVSGPNANGQRTYSQNQINTPLPLLNIRAAQAGPNGLQRIIDKKGRAFEVLPAPLANNGKSLIKNSDGKDIEIERIETATGKRPVFFDSNNQKISLPEKPVLNTQLAAKVAPHLSTLDTRTAKNMVQAFRHGSNKVVFVDSNGNTIEPTQGQAGTSAVLLGQNQSLVYYATMVNDVFAYFQTGIANGSIPNSNNISPPGNFPTALFPTTQAELDPVIAYAASKGVTFPDKEALAMEIKSAWIDATGIEALGFKLGDYLSVKTQVPEYDKSNPMLWIPTGKNKSLTLALVGMHVVGSAKGHPEMIWATFEHMNNAPNTAYTYTNSVNKTITVPQNSHGKWLFAAPDATTYNVQKAKFCASQNVGDQCPASSTNYIAALVPTGVAASDTLRLKAFGSGSDASNATLENTEVISTNNSVRSQLLKGDIRANYILTGATWTVGGQVVTTSNQAGTNLLANTTMETYDQGIDSKKNNGSNCFACHTNGAQPVGQKANTSVSHIFRKLVPLYPKSSAGTK